MVRRERVQDRKRVHTQQNVQKVSFELANSTCKPQEVGTPNHSSVITP